MFLAEPGQGKMDTGLSMYDPDEIEVIADSFDEYLQMLMDDEYWFVNEDTLEE